VGERDETGPDRRDAKGGVCRLGASDLHGEALRLFIGWSEAAERPVKGAKVGIVGITRNEDVPDLRNSRVPDIVELGELGIVALVADPLADADEAKREYGIELVSLADFAELDGLILAVRRTECSARPGGRSSSLRSPRAFLWKSSPSLPVTRSRPAPLPEHLRVL